MITKLQFIGSQRLGIEDGAGEDTRISLGGENREDFYGWAGGGSDRNWRFRWRG